MVDFLKNALSIFEDRSKSRLWPTFTVVWIIHNWKFLLIILRSPYTEHQSPVAELDKITSDYNSFLLIPLAVSFLIVITVPYLDAIIGWIQYNAIYWNKGINNYLQIRIDIRKARLIKKQADALRVIEASESKVSSAKLGGSEFDYAVFSRLEAILNEAFLRSVVSELKNNSKINEGDISKIESYIINGGTVENRFKDGVINACHVDFYNSIRELSKVIREIMYRPTNNFVYVIDKNESPDKKNRVNNAAVLALEKYVVFREKIREVYQK